MTKTKRPRRAADALPTLLLGLLASGSAQARSSTGVSLGMTHIF